MQGRKKLAVSLCVLILPLWHTVTAAASEFNFAVTTVIPESQTDKGKTYFDLQLSPHQQEELHVKLRNDTDKDITVAVSVNSATTNSNGVVEYGKSNSAKDDSLDIDLSDYVEFQEMVALKAQSETTVPFKVTMPGQPFDGVLAGGITFKEVLDKEKETGKTAQGLSIKNEYSYVVALLMRQNFNEVEPRLLLGEVKADQINARNVILANVQNDQKTYINQVAIRAEIKKKGSSEVLYAEDKSGLQIAPNSNFSFPISLNGAALESGDYHLSLMIYANKSDTGEFVTVSDDGQEDRFTHHWQFEEDFNIEKKQAQALNATDVTLKQQSHTWLYVVIAILIFLLLVTAANWLLWKKKSNVSD